MKALLERMSLSMRRIAPNCSDTICQFQAKDTSRVAPLKTPHCQSDKASFKVRLAHDEERTQEALQFVRERYRATGIGSGAGHGPSPDRITLVVYHNYTVVGSATLSIDSPHGLLADTLYQVELDKLRAGNRKICEITKLAVDRINASQQILAAIFNVLYIYAREQYKCDDLVIEVNPRHTAFYKKKLGFETWGGLKQCERVDAPAELLHVDLGWAERKIAMVGGNPEAGKNDLSIYPHFFSLVEQAGIARRISQIEHEADI